MALELEKRYNRIKKKKKKNHIQIENLITKICMKYFDL